MGDKILPGLSFHANLNTVSQNIKNKALLAMLAFCQLTHSESSQL